MFRLEKKLFEESCHLLVPARSSIPSVVQGGIITDSGYTLKKEKVHLDIKKKIKNSQTLEWVFQSDCVVSFEQIFKTQLAEAVCKLI